MPHFGIESLGHGTGGFLDSINISPIVPGLTGAATITGTSTIQATLSDSFAQARAILDNILSGGELPETFRESVVTTNLLGLGQASIDISKALNEQVAIRENQLARTQEAIRNNQLAQNSINEAFTTTLGDIGKSISDIGQGGFDPIKFVTDNPLLGGIGIGGLAVGAVVLFLVLK